MEPQRNGTSTQYVPPVAKQLEFKKVNGWGGKRRGAGRKNRTGTVSHAKREKVDIRHPMNITWKLKPKTAFLRCDDLRDEFRKAVQVAKKFGLFVVHYSIQGDHIHMVVEAKSNLSLARGMRSLGARFGKAIRKAIGGRGSVFAGRYHLHVMKTPTEVKNALAYVLTNISKHTNLITYIDEFSSGYAFHEWRKLLGRKVSALLLDQLKDPRKPRHPELSEAQSWLLRVGWMRAY